MYGWRARIGLLLPGPNTTMEPEFYKMAPEGVTTHTIRLSIKELTTEGLIEMDKEVADAARKIMDVGPNVLVFGCTSGSFAKGARHDEELVEEMEDISGRPAVSTSNAVLKALHHLKIRKVAVATPYNEEINEKERHFLEANGFRVTKIRGLGYRNRAPFYPLADLPVSTPGLHDPSVAYRLALDVFSEEADGIFISCTNFRTIEIIDILEKSVGRPVVTSNQATMIAALRKVGIRDQIKGYGSLMESF